MATLTTIWNFIKGLPRFGKEILVGLVAILIILWEASGKKKAEQDAEVAEATKADAVDAQKQEDLKKEDKQVQQDGETKKQEVSKKTPEELAKELNNV